MTGRLLPGARIGGGNPNAKRQHELKKALMACATEADVQAVYNTLLDAAKSGDVQAAKVWLDHLVGRPSQPVELTGGDGDPLKIDMGNLTAVIMAALGPHSEARIAVAAALRQIGRTPEVNHDGTVDGDGAPA